MTGLPSSSFVSDLRMQLRQAKVGAVEQFKQSRPNATAASRLIRGLAKLADQTLCQLWQHCDMPACAALLAVGGYGRGELFPASDVDVLVLLPDTGSHEQPYREALESFVTACWDIGLEIGSSVRTVEECIAQARQDVTIQTALLEARWLCGDLTLFKRLREAHQASLNPKDFFVTKSLEMSQRHAKYEETPYALEPNCKESPGGLRDLHILMWTAHAAGLGRNWAEMATQGLLTPFEAQQLKQNEGLLKLIRTLLHLVSGRREDRLIFDLQTAVAESLGYTHSKTQRASEALMHRYYWTAKAVTQLNQVLRLNIEEQVQGGQPPPMRRINEHFWDRDGMLEVASDDLYRRDPGTILETFLTFQQEVGIEGLSARTLRALYNARDVMDAAFRRDPRNRVTFMRILQAPSGHTHVFRLLNQTSVLGRYLWAFRRIVGKMQHDLFHVYTVDQHILMVLRNVRRFFIPEHTHEYPLCSQLAAQWDKPWILYIAALFHDIAKGRGGDHSDLGAIEARRFCRHHHVAPEDAQLIEFLVQNHLLLSKVAQKDDLSDPEVIASFAQRMQTERQLTALYLLTVADIRGTSPKVWNAWKGKLLEDLYRLTLHALGGRRPNVDATIEAHKQEARRLLALNAFLPGSEHTLWERLQVSYFARHDASDLAWHARCLNRLTHSPQPVVCARVSPIGEGLQVLVYTPDKADLFARICGYFDRASFNIVDAKVHTTTDGYALDTFQVMSPHLQDHYRDLIALVQTQLTLALLDTTPLNPPSPGRLSRRVRSFPVTPRISLRPDDRAQSWLLTVHANDRSGLLYSIALVLSRHQINLQLAKVTTLGERIEDTFLVQGDALQRNRLRLRIETELLEAVGT